MNEQEITLGVCKGKARKAMRIEQDTPAPPVGDEINADGQNVLTDSRADWVRTAGRDELLETAKVVLDMIVEDCRKGLCSFNEGYAQWARIGTAYDNRDIEALRLLLRDPCPWDTRERADEEGPEGVSVTLY